MTSKLVSVEFTRPTNITQYGIADCVGPAVTALLTFTNIARMKGGIARILGAWLRKSTNVVTNASFRLHLFNATVTATADNSPLAIAWADRAKYQGQLSFANMLATASICASIGETIDTVAGVAVPMPIQLAADSTTLYGALEAAAAYTPGNAEQFQIVLAIES